MLSTGRCKALADICNPINNWIYSSSTFVLVLHIYTRSTSTLYQIYHFNVFSTIWVTRFSWIYNINVFLQLYELQVFQNIPYQCFLQLYELHVFPNIPVQCFLQLYECYGCRLYPWWAGIIPHTLTPVEPLITCLFSRSLAHFISCGSALRLWAPAYASD
jgi:hypothetical protein